LGGELSTRLTHSGAVYVIKQLSPFLVHVAVMTTMMMMTQMDRETLSVFLILLMIKQLLQHQYIKFQTSFDNHSESRSIWSNKPAK